MASEALIDQLNDILSVIAEISVEKLLNNPNWGLLNFDECRRHLEATVSLSEQLKSLQKDSLWWMPDNKMQTLVSLLTSLNNYCKQISSFSITSGNVHNSRTQIISNIALQASQLYEAVVPYLAYSKLQSTDFTKTEVKIEALLEDAVTKIGEIKTKEAEANTIIKAIRDASAKGGVAQFALDFHKTSGEENTRARKWLKAASIFAVITLVAAAAMVFYPIDPAATTPQLIQLFTSKIVILGLLLTCTIWCGRLYKAARHQVAINKHRANGLQTFQTFVQASDDASTKNAVLMETTKSIFAITPSGYLENESVSDGGLKMIEVVKQVKDTVA